MKKYLNLFLLAITFSLGSCLKEDMPLSPKDSNNVLEIYQQVPDLITSGTTSTYASYLENFPIGNEQEWSIVVNYAGEGTAPQDITVKLDLNEDAIDVYNDQEDDEAILLPSELYKTGDWTVTIPKGQKTATFKVTLYTDQFDFTESYVFPIRIASASYGEISKNYGTIVYKVQALNKYDGLYTITATAPMVDVTSSTLTGYYPMTNMSLITMGGNSVTLYDGRYFGYGYYHPIRSGASSISSYGNFSPIFVFDDDGKITDVKNYYGSSNANARDAKLNPTGVNKATFSSDGSVESIEVSYIMTQSGTNRTYFYEKFARTGAR